MRRSGTTVFWETFRNDPTTLCFDEPYHPALWQGERWNSKDTWNELAEFWADGTKPSIMNADPIHPLDELGHSLTDGQMQYLAALYEQGPRVVIDSVRLWSKLTQVTSAERVPFVVHLVRHPKTWVSAHLLPGGGTPTWRGRLGNIYRRKSFFSRKGFYNNWHYETIINDALESQGDRADLWDPLKIPVEDIKTQSAVRKLLAFWWAVTLRAERQLAELSGDRYVTITMEEFIAQPRFVMESIYARCGWSGADAISLEHLRPVRDAWKNDSPLWRDACMWAGIPPSLWERGSFPGELVQQEARRYIQ